MNDNAFVRALCRILIACFAASSITAQAGLIGTDQAVAGAAANVAGAREARATVAAQLEALGLTADSARARVAAISDAEALEIAGRIDSAAAGAVPGVTVGMLLVLAFLIWRFGFSEQAQAEQKAREPAKKEPAKK
ncbi:MAG: PA2779 family protein [Burkholderiales bacterium]